MNDGATCTVLLPNSAYIHQRKLKLLLSLKEGSQRGSRGFPGGSVGKESACNVRDPSSIPGLERSAGKGIGYPVQYSCASLVAQLRKNLLARQEAWVQSLGWEDSLEKEIATHSSILVWEIPWTEEPGGLQSMGLDTT